MRYVRSHETDRAGVDTWPGGGACQRAVCPEGNQHPFTLGRAARRTSNGRALLQRTLQRKVHEEAVRERGLTSRHPVAFVGASVFAPAVNRFGLLPPLKEGEHELASLVRESSHQAGQLAKNSVATDHFRASSRWAMGLLQ